MVLQYSQALANQQSGCPLMCQGAGAVGHGPIPGGSSWSGPHWPWVTTSPSKNSSLAWSHAPFGAEAGMAVECGGGVTTKRLYMR